MIKKLRRQFILITGLSIAVLIIVVLIPFNLFVYRNQVRQMTTILNMIAENDGSLPDVAHGRFDSSGQPLVIETESEDILEDYSTEFVEPGGSVDTNGSAAANETAGVVDSMDAGGSVAAIDSEGTVGSADAGDYVAAIESESANGSVEAGGSESAVDSVASTETEESTLSVSQIATLFNYIYKRASKVVGAFTSDEFELTPENRFQLRYFSVEFDENGEPLWEKMDHIATVGRDEACAMARKIIKRHAGKNWFGFINRGSYIYAYKSVPVTETAGSETSGTAAETMTGATETSTAGSVDVSGTAATAASAGTASTLVVFLDVTREISEFENTRLVSIIIGLGVAAIFIFIVTMISSRVMRPFIENMENQKQFITNAGHELKTPLAIISANTEVLEMLNGENEWTQSTMNQVKRSTALINELISLSKMSEGTEVELSAVDFSAQVKESADSFRPVIEQQGKSLSENIQEGLTVKAETRLLASLINILIDNAGKYCDDGGEIEVNLAAGERGKKAIFTVANTFAEGKGVDTKKFFDRFYRGDTSHNSKKQGYGIGLSMASSIVEKFGGTIGAGWKNGVITFTVKLPTESVKNNR